jgi:hypothetical protein
MRGPYRDFVNLVNAERRNVEEIIVANQQEAPE